MSPRCPDPASSAPSTSKISYESSRQARDPDTVVVDLGAVASDHGEVARDQPKADVGSQSEVAGASQPTEVVATKSKAKAEKIEHGQEIEPEKSKVTSVGQKVEMGASEDVKKNEVDITVDRKSVLQDTFEDFNEDSNHVSDHYTVSKFTLLYVQEFLSELVQVQEAIDNFDQVIWRGLKIS